MTRVADQAVTLAARLTPLPARIQALMTGLSEYVSPHLVDRKARRDAIQTEAMAIVQESWALSTEVQRLAALATRRGGPMRTDATKCPRCREAIAL